MATEKSIIEQRFPAVAALPAHPEEELVASVLGRILAWRGPLLAVADLVTIAGAFLFAYYLRFHLEFLAIKRVGMMGVELYVRGGVLLAGIWCFLLWRRGAYAAGLFSDGSRMLSCRHVIVSGGEALAALMAISFLYRGLLLSRQVYLMTGVMAVAMMVIVRLLVRAFEQEAVDRGLIATRLLIVGTCARARGFAERLLEQRPSIELLGFLSWDGAAAGTNFLNKPVFGTVAELAAVHERQSFDRILLANPPADGDHDERHEVEVLQVLNFCEARGIGLYNVPHHFSVMVKEEEMGLLCGMPLVRMQDASQHPGYMIVKRAMDLAISATVLILGLPFWLVVPLLIKLEDGGPVFFTQTRVGLHGRHFRMFKFRSMAQDAEARLADYVDLEKLDVPGFKIKNDPRVTRIGRFLRRTSLDELPQIFNVLRGEMSIVGPRPEMPWLVEKYTPAQRRRLKARPGLTGYMQIHRRGCPLADAESINLDLLYLKEQSLLLDLFIIFRTAWVVICGKGVTY